MRTCFFVLYCTLLCTTFPFTKVLATTTLGFKLSDGVVIAVDSKASVGSYVGSRTVQKILPISSHIVGTMAGGAAGNNNKRQGTSSATTISNLF
jgi:hypothetical protein